MSKFIKAKKFKQSLNWLFCFITFQHQKKFSFTFSLVEMVRTCPTGWKCSVYWTLYDLYV